MKSTRIDVFLDNEFTKKYFDIIEKRKNKDRIGYMEKHHIIPKSLGGSNNKDNLVWLSAKDHYICHQLLVKMTDGVDNMKMWSGLWRMMNKQSHNQKRDFNIVAEDYEFARKKHSENQKQRMLGEKNFFYGKTHTEETKKLMSAGKKGKTYEEIFGVEYAKIMKKRRSSEQLGKIKGPQSRITCPHCKKEGGESIMKRWHFDNCKNMRNN